MSVSSKLKRPSKRHKLNTSSSSEEQAILRQLAEGVSAPFPLTDKPTLPPHEEEKRRNIDSFLDHLRTLLWKMPGVARSDLQEEIIATAYQRNRELRNARKPAPQFDQPYQQQYQAPCLQQYHSSQSTSTTCMTCQARMYLEYLCCLFLLQSLVRLIFCLLQGR